MRGQASGSESLRHSGPTPRYQGGPGAGGGGAPALCWLGVPRTLQPFQRALFIEHQLYAKLNWGDNTTLQGPLEGCEWLPPSGSLPGLGRLSPCHAWLPSRTSPAPLSSVRLCIRLSLAPDLLGPSWGGCLGVGAREDLGVGSPGRPDLEARIPGLPALQRPRGGFLLPSPDSGVGPWLAASSANLGLHVAAFRWLCGQVPSS